MALKSIQLQIHQLKTTNTGSAFALAVPRPCDTVQEVLDLDEKLGSPDYRRSLVRSNL
jgi:hypothetical protein